MKRLILKSFISLSILSVASASFAMQRPSRPLPQTPAMYNGQPLPALPPRPAKVAQSVQQPAQYYTNAGQAVPAYYPNTRAAQTAPSQDAINLQAHVRQQVAGRYAQAQQRRAKSGCGGVQCANAMGAGF